MKISKRFTCLLFVILGTVLVFVTIFEIVAIKTESLEMKSNIDFLKKPEGIYGENILALHAFGFIDPVDEFYSYGYCNCSRASYRKPNPGINPYCSIYHDPIPMHIIRSNIGGKILIEFR